MRRGGRRFALGVALLAAAVALAPVPARAQAKPEGEMRWALYVTVPPAWFDPGDVVGVITPFWILYALHDALVKPMPGNHLTPSLAESWTVSADQKVYEFKLRQGVKFHNGDPFTAEDVKFSFHRAKAKLLHEKVKDVVIADPHRVRFVLHEPWPDFMTFYGTFVSGAGWVVPKKYIEQVGVEGFRKHPIGLGPYKFVSINPGIELVMEAYEGYWRKMPSVKRLVYKSVPDATTRLAMLKRGEVDLAYLIDVPMAEDIKRDPTLKLAFSGGIGTTYLDFLDMWDPKSPWHDKRVRQAASLAIDRRGLSDAETVGASIPTGNVVPKGFEFAIPIEPDPYNPARAKQLLAEAGYPKGFDAGDLYPWPPYFSTGETVTNYLAAIGIKTRVRTMERAAFYSALSSKKLKGLCVCVNAVYGNAASRLSETVPAEGNYAYGAWPDIEALYAQQGRETDRKKREAMLRQIQQQLSERVRFAPIYDYIWPSAVGPRVAEPALMLINPVSLVGAPRRRAPQEIVPRTQGDLDARDVGEGADQAGSAEALPRGHRGGRPGLGAGRARLSSLQRAAGREGRQRLLLLRGVQGPGGAGGPSPHPALRDVAGGGRYARWSHRAHPLRDGLPRRAALLGQGLAAAQRWPIARFATSTVFFATSKRLVSLVSTSPPVTRMKKVSSPNSIEWMSPFANTAALPGSLRNSRWSSSSAWPGRLPSSRRRHRRIRVGFL